jgi:hypothetical protein
MIDVNQTTSRRRVDSDQALVITVCLMALLGMVAFFAIGG